MNATDRLDIIETTTRMAWLADLRDWDALVDVFTDQVDVDYTSLTGGDPAMTTTWANGNQNIMALAAVSQSEVPS